MRVKVILPNADGSAAITLQEIENTPSDGDILVYENGNAVRLVNPIANLDGDPDGADWTIGGVPIGFAVHLGRNV